MNRYSQAWIPGVISCLTGLLILVYGFFLPQNAYANSPYLLRVKPADESAVIPILDQVKSEAPGAYLVYEGNQPLIMVGEYPQLHLAAQRQTSLQEMGLTVELLQNQNGTLRPVTPPLDPVAASPAPSQTVLYNPESSGVFPWFPYHFPYAVVVESFLDALPGSRSVMLHRDAAQSFQIMQTHASQEGIQLVPLSGFRTLAVQRMLFHRQIARQGSEAAARRLSAPPGHSEHHTGFALDIGDGRYPATHVQYSFAQTPAFRWLDQHAGDYGFELSFPEQNFQGVSYEPWHWRYIGTSEAKAVFAQVQQWQAQQLAQSN